MVPYSSETAPAKTTETSYKETGNGILEVPASYARTENNSGDYGAHTYGLRYPRYEAMRDP